MLQAYVENNCYHMDLSKYIHVFHGTYCKSLNLCEQLIFARKMKWQK